MTSFMIKDHEDRPLPPSWIQDPECPFCRIIKRELPSLIVYEDEKIIAFLDILPLRRGHTLVVPKPHIPKLTELPPEFAAAVGVAVAKVAQALTLALGNTALNVVCNQEWAQGVPHVHYHVVPAPTFESSSGVDSESTDGVPGDNKTSTIYQEMLQNEFNARKEIDRQDAEILVTQIRARFDGNSV